MSLTFRSSTVAVAFLLVLCLASTSPAVQAAAQTTSIHQINGPSSVVAGSEAPLQVTVIIYYNNTVAGSELLVGILDADLSPARIVPGVVTASTDACVNEPQPAALCAITVQKSSGAEHISFQIGGIFGGRRTPGVWNLNVTSALFDHQGNLIAASVSSELFKVDLVPVALNVNVPSNVAVSVDAVSQTPGPVSVGVALGQHNLTVPQLVNITQFTRLRFDHWSDGYPSTFRSILVTNATTLKADYVTQNLLTLIGVQGNATYSWYDSSNNATFSAPQYQAAPGVLGTLGGRLSLQGWYENGQLITNSPTGTIAMDKPHALTAVWQLDYSIPAAILLVIVAAAIAGFLLLRRRRRTPTVSGSSKRRRKRS